MIFGGFQPLSLIDYPGKVCAIAFTSGCNFYCSFCHNPELVSPDLIKTQPQIAEADILHFLEERKGKLEALCISGGEPTLHNDLIDFLKRVKNLGYLIKLDTNGTNPNVLTKIFQKELVDYVAMDIKAPLIKEKYEQITRRPVVMATIIQSVELIKEQAPDYEFRTTVEPLLNKKDIINIANALKPAKKYFLQEFHSTKTLNKDYLGKKGLSKEEIEEIKELIKNDFGIVGVR